MFAGNKVMEPRRQNQGGQAVVEFALILIILLMIIFVVIESARLFQANLTVQNAARDAGRYAITGEFDPSCLADDPPCDDPRLVSVKEQALAALSGLRLDPNAAFNDPYYYLVEVFSLDDEGNWIPDTLGGPGDPILVRVTYRLGIVTPIISSIARTVQLRGQVVYNNEETRQTSLTSGANPGSDDAPNLPPLPTTGPTPTATPVPPFLEISKSATESEVELNETFGYEIQVRNTGGGPATNVILTDDLSSRVQYTEGAADCTTPTVPGGQIICELGELASGASETITFVVQAVEVGLATNNAAVTSDEVGPVSASASTVIIDPASADLDIRKTVPSTQMTVGQEFDYEIRVRNLGPSAATEVVVTDALPDELDFVSATTTAGECEYDDGSRTLTCTNPEPFAANGPHMVITLSVVAAEAGPVSNTASVTALEPDPVDNNNSSTATIFVDPVADMSIVKTVEPVEVGVREFMTYTLSITNNGPEPASNVTVIDDLPDGVGLVSISTPVGTCEQQPNTSAEILCLLGTLEADVTVNIEIVAIPTVGITNVTNTATVGADELDPEQGNNSSSVNVFVEPRADLSITKIASESRVHVDDDFVYTLQVTNSPDSFTDAPNVTVSDQLDIERVTFVSAVPSQGSCSVNQSGEVFCTLGDMAIGAEATIDITVDPRPVNAEGDGGGNLLNSAVVAYGGATDYEDLEPDDNEDNVTIYVGPGAETISLEPICGDPGDTVLLSGDGWTTSGDHDMTITFDPGGDFEAVFDAGTIQPDADGSWTGVEITIPDTLTIEDNRGFYTILAEGRVDEEATAQFEIPCPAPDLTATDLTLVSPPAVSTEDTAFEATITNIGRADAGAFTVALYFDPDPPPAEGDTEIASGQVATAQVGGLAQGESTTVTLEVPDGFPDHGTHSAWVLADSSDAIDEELETNNFTGDDAIEVLARPAAEDDEYETDEDTTLNVAASGVLANDDDADAPNSELTAEFSQGPSDGTLELNGDGSFTYTPDQDFNGSDSFTYQACDATNLCSTSATVSVTVNPVNDDPVANDDTETTDEDTPVDIDVLDNDTDVDGDTLTVSAVTQPANGTVTNNTDSVTYDPNPDFNGTDTFNYTVDDGNGATDTATVTVTVDAVNDPPVAEDDEYPATEDTTLEVDAPGVLENDTDEEGDDLTVTDHTQPGNGTVEVSADGSFTYTPNPDFCGEDTFDYTVSDGNDSDTGTVTINVACVNDAPEAVNDTATVNKDTPRTIDVLANDSDPDPNDTLTITAVSGATLGSVEIIDETSVLYTPASGETGNDSFTYTISDGNGGTDTATVTISVIEPS